MPSYTPAHYRGDPLLSSAGPAPRRPVLLRRDPRARPRRSAARAAPGRGSTGSSTPPASRTPASTASRAWWPSLSRTAAELWQRQVDGIEGGWEVMFDYERWVLMRRMTSRRQLLEVMTEFWENHLNVPGHRATRSSCTAPPTATRSAPHALGRFDDLLHAAITHPAMLIYLDNAVSTASAPQREPRPRAARAAHRRPRPVRRGRRQGQRPDPHRLDRRHVEHLGAVVRRAGGTARGTVTVMGFSRPQRRRRRPRPHPALPLLPRAPPGDRARGSARKLAVKFVGDDPSAALVDHLAQVYLDHDTAIVPVLRALVASTEFQRLGRRQGPRPRRGPGRDLPGPRRHPWSRPTGDDGRRQRDAVAGRRASGTMPVRVAPARRAADRQRRPGPRPSRLLASMSMHYAMSGGWWPDDGDHLPLARLVAAEAPGSASTVLVDHLSQRLLHRRSTARLLRGLLRGRRLTPERADHPRPPAREVGDAAAAHRPSSTPPTFLTR